jgi:hypothetical protein
MRRRTRSGEHDRAVLVLLEGAAELVGDLPDERDLVVEALRCHALPLLPANAPPNLPAVRGVGETSGRLATRRERPAEGCQTSRLS